MIRPLLAAALLLAPSGVLAQSDGASGRAPDRVRSVTLTGDQKCPESTDEEVVVCSRINPDEQYRIPKEMRDAAEVPANRSSWVNRAATIDRVGRVAGGLPDSCSPVGTGGQSGCTQMWNRLYAADKKDAERNDALVPGGGD
jgi:hypothetical protein